MKIMAFMCAVLLAVLLAPVFTVPVQAAPFLVCDPQAGITHYRLTGPSWVPSAQPAEADGRLRLDVSAAPVGETSLTVKACKADLIWGEVCSSADPFTFTRPGIAGPTSIGLAPQ